MVVISIVAILFSVGIVSYNNFNRGQLLSQAAKTLKNDLRLAQSNALSGEKDCSREADGGCGGTTAGCGNDNNGSERHLDGWFVTFALTSYEISGYCQGVKFGSKRVTLPDSVSFIPIPGVIQFKPLALGVSGETTAILNAFNRSQTIMITSTGEIK